MRVYEYSHDRRHLCEKSYWFVAWNCFVFFFLSFSIWSRSQLSSQNCFNQFWFDATFRMVATSCIPIDCSDHWLFWAFFHSKRWLQFDIVHFGNLIRIQWQSFLLSPIMAVYSNLCSDVDLNAQPEWENRTGVIVLCDAGRTYWSKIVS